MSGGTAALTITATQPSAPTALQVVVRADATSGTVVQTHTAALLLSTSSAPADLGPPAADLAQPPDGRDAGSSDDLSSGGGTGGGGEPMPPPSKSGCSFVLGTSAPASPWAEATPFLLAFLLVTLRRRQRRAWPTRS
jgi:hypothetical protein